MTSMTEQVAEVAIVVAATALRLPTVRAEALKLADDAGRAGLTHRAYLAEVLSAEVDEREARRRERRVAETRLPRVKRLSDFDLSAAPFINPATFAAACSLSWVDAGQPLVAVGDPGTGKAHLLIGVALAAAEAGKRARYVTCTGLVNELAEAADERTLGRAVARSPVTGATSSFAVTSSGYLKLDQRGAELLFQALTEREERASVAVASNAPFSE